MVKIKRRNGTYWEREDKVMETVLIDKKIKTNFRAFAKERGINKSKLIEELYTQILLRMASNTLNTSGGYVTLCILREPIQKKKLI